MIRGSKRRLDFGTVMSRRRSPPAASPDGPSASLSPSLLGIEGGSGRKWILAILLAVASVAVYAPTWWYGTLSYDDPTYVIDNVHVTSGLSGQNVVWSFTSIYDANWIPLTWISLMLDVDLCGGRPSGFHITNTLLHAACAVLLFLALARATGNDLRSAFVAALFMRRIRCTSNRWAWISERIKTS